MQPGEEKEIPVTLEGGKLVFRDPPVDALKLLIVDTETTGFTTEDSEVIEIAAAEMIVDRVTGETYSIEPLFDYFREPLRSKITDVITDVTNIRFSDVVGQNVDYDVLYAALDRCDILAAHHMKFDFPFLEDLAHELIDNPKRCACTCHDPKWKKYGMPNKKLKTIVEKSGHKFIAHRAINDVNATAYMLALYPDGVKCIIDKALADIVYHLNVANVPWGYNDKMNDVDITWNKPTKSFIGDFVTMQDVLDTRTKLQEIFGRSFSTLDITLTTTTPYLRFSK